MKYFITLLFLSFILSCKDYKEDFRKSNLEIFELRKEIDSLKNVIKEKDSIIRQADNYINVMEY